MVDDLVYHTSSDLSSQFDDIPQFIQLTNYSFVQNCHKVIYFMAIGIFQICHFLRRPISGSTAGNQIPHLVPPEKHGEPEDLPQPLRIAVFYII